MIGIHLYTSEVLKVFGQPDRNLQSYRYDIEGFRSGLVMVCNEN